MRFVIVILALICIANAAVYEARNSDDVDFFLEHNPEENGALLFYNKPDSTKPEVANAIDSVLSIFKNVGEEGRANEEWVDKLNDKVHIMQIDVSDVDSARVVKDFKVGQTPFLVLLDKGKSLMQEVADAETFEHIKEIYVGQQNAKEAAAKKAADQASVTPSSVFPDAESVHKSNDPSKDAQASVEAAQKAQKAAQEAQKAADEALKALQEARKAFDQHTKLEALKREAEEAKKKAEEAKKQLDEAKKQIADHLADDAKKNSQNGQQNQGGNNNQNQGESNNQNQGGNNNQGGYNNQNQGGQQNNQGYNQGSQQNGQGSQQGAQPNFPKVTPPPGYTVDYVPVLKPIGGAAPSSGYSIVQPSYTPTTKANVRRIS